MAAGVLALSMYMALGKNEKPKSFTAGKLSMDYGGGRVSAASLRKQAEALLAAYLKDQGFDFVGVRS